jgi:hypothetical protein
MTHIQAIAGEIDIDTAVKCPLYLKNIKNPFITYSELTIPRDNRLRNAVEMMTF